MLGNLFGMWWAYVELGWGGYFAWDPVENASFLPWLTGTAFLHSIMMQRRRGMLKVWNVVLIIITFELAIFGTFLTRSGIINSVHTFGDSTLGPFFLSFIAVS
jgi:cytochrome c-type biogenesis protein CcmF